MWLSFFKRGESEALREPRSEPVVRPRGDQQAELDEAEADGGSATRSLIDRVVQGSCLGRGRRGRSNRGLHREAKSGAPLGVEYIDVLGNRRSLRLPSSCAGRRSVYQSEYRRISCLSPFIKCDAFIDQPLQFIQFRR